MRTRLPPSLCSAGSRAKFPGPKNCARAETFRLELPLDLLLAQRLLFLPTERLTPVETEEQGVAGERLLKPKRWFRRRAVVFMLLVVLLLL